MRNIFAVKSNCPDHNIQAQVAYALAFFVLRKKLLKDVLQREESLAYSDVCDLFF